MRSTLYNAGTTLALLALGLQVAVCAIGGRVCYQASPQPTAPVECASACCHAEATVENVAPRMTSSTGLPGQSTDSDCCLEPTPEHAWQVTWRTLDLTPDQLAPLPPTMAFEAPMIGPSRNASAPTWIASLPPPSLPQIRTTVLLI